MFSCIDFGIVILSIFSIIFVKLINKNPKPILNVYQRPNGMFWLKTFFMYCILKLRKLKSKKNEVYQVMDKPQPLSDHEKAIDAVYFNGAASNGDHFVVGTARRNEGLVDGFMYLKIKSSGLGVLETPKVPDTSLYQEEEKEAYEAEGIKITNIEPMRLWVIEYDGKMKNKEHVYDVKLKATWSSQMPIFNFDSDMDPYAMAKSMAYEKWSREYFTTLQANHQTHYEQHGELKGVVSVNGNKYDINLNTVRDHSFGVKREWRNFHRYGLHFFSLENGDRFSVGMICLPISFSRFTLGYVYKKEDNKLYPVTDCDLQLYQHGEDAEPPVDYAFSFQAGGTRYTVQVNVVESPYFFISKDWESKVFERLCTFDINGVKGWGAAEWQYRNTEGRHVKL